MKRAPILWTGLALVLSAALLGATLRPSALAPPGPVLFSGLLSWRVDNQTDIGTSATAGRPRDAYVARDLHVAGYLHVQSALSYGTHVVTIASNGVGASANGEILSGLRSVYLIDCNDVDGCNVFLGETSVSVGQMVILVNVGVNALTITDGGTPPTGASVLHLAGSFTAATSQTISLIYAKNRSGDGNFYELSRSAN